MTSTNDKTPMTQEAASRIQSHADRTGTNQDFKARAQSAAATRTEKCHYCGKDYPADQVQVNKRSSNDSLITGICHECFARLYKKTKCFKCNKEFYSACIPTEEICSNCFNQYYSVCPDCDTVFKKENGLYRLCRSCQNMEDMRNSSYDDYDDDIFDDTENDPHHD